MAILRDDEDSNQAQGMNQPNQNAASNGSQPVQVSDTSSSMAPSPSAPATAPSNQPNPKASSGSFTNLRQYINANQGNKVASSVGQKVSSTATGAQRAIDQGQAAFGQKVEQGSLANREGAVQDIKGIVQQARGITAKPQTPQAATPAAPSAGTSPALEAAAPPAQAPSYLQDLNSQRFQDVINARYQGPESLRQSGLYDPISGKVQTAQTKINQAQTAAGRENLLKDTFGQNRQYTRGQNKLDALLLNTSKEGVQNLLDQKAKAGNLQNALQTAENTSLNLATNRAGEIQGIQGQARQAFATEQAAERQATEDRLSNVVKDWDKLPEYFKQIIRSNPAGALNLGTEEAAMLGIKSGEGLYNLGEEAIRTGVSDKDKLISRDEQARQFALAQLAGLDTSKMLDTNVMRSDLSKAGTQTAADALDLAGTRAALNEAEKSFREQAQSQNITGVGSKKNKTSGKRYYSEAKANLGDVFKNAGYNFDAPLSNQIGNADLLRGVGASTNISRDQDLGAKQYEASSLEGAISQNIDPNVELSNAWSPYTDNSNLARKATYGLADAGSLGVTAGLRALGLDTTGAITSGIDSVLGSNIFGGSSSKESKKIAQSGAEKDLQDKIQQAITQSGFQNRALVGDTEQTNARAEALRQMLAKMDKTNA